MGMGAETENRNGNWQSSCYSSDSLPVKLTELCKPSHKYLIVFLSHNKRWPAQNSILTDAICDLLYDYTILLSYLTLKRRLSLFI